MKTFTCLLLSIFLIGSAFCDEWINISSNQTVPATMQIVSSTVSTNVLEINIEGFTLQEVETPQGIAYILVLENSTRILQAEAPDLPKLTASLMIPDLAEMKAEVISSSYKEYENILIAPSKGNLTRDIDPATMEYTYGSAYEKNNFFPGDLTDLRDPYIIRDFRGQAVQIFPFQYNPVTKTLRVYNKIVVKVAESGQNGINPIYRSQLPGKVDQQFSAIYHRHFLNYDNAEYTPVEEQGNMLIISHGPFMAAMQDFVNWKK
ncbi:MAG: hypothetical protein K8R53_03075, partial [Bacteroidales bacterium]|nr:hypothetical protein [Bacteroidales bacterium]